MKVIKILFSSDYGMLGALLGLCALFSIITYEEQQPVGAEGANRLLPELENLTVLDKSVVIAGKGGDEGKIFADSLQALLEERGWQVKKVVKGGPPELGRGLRDAFAGNARVSVLACEQSFANMPVLENLKNFQQQIEFFLHLNEIQHMLSQNFFFYFFIFKI